MKSLLIPVILSILIYQSLSAQSPHRRLADTEKRIQKHLSILASDSLEGRRAGTKGEEKAAAYIQDQFKTIGLIPKGNEGSYIQRFSIPDGKKLSNSSLFHLNNVNMAPNIDFIPLSFSADASIISNNTHTSVSEIGKPWFIDIQPFLAENSNNPHADIHAILYEKALFAEKKGATAVIFYTSHASLIEHVTFDPKYKGPSTKIPVILLLGSAASTKSLIKETQVDIKLHIQWEKVTRSCHNVIGYLDRNAKYTIVIGAHYDHLGYGEDGNSMIRTKVNDIHNGADDNASGTSALIEMARLYKKNKRFTSYNILFIAFSAEELGLLGSNYFLDTPTITLQNISFMINMDMVGRLNDSSKTLTVGGFGTSPTWGDIFPSIDKKIVIKLDSSGTGPSDHASFYRKDIPVLFFFTGLHGDYHKPSDDAEKINTKGIVTIIQLISDILSRVPAEQKLIFKKTREQQTSTNARFTVSLGIMPDYSYDGKGVRIEGLSEGKIAQRVGLLPGDVLVKLGESEISSVETYMKALSTFKKGNRTSVTVQRGSQEFRYEIEFK